MSDARHCSRRRSDTYRRSLSRAAGEDRGLRIRRIRRTPAQHYRRGARQVCAGLQALPSEARTGRIAQASVEDKAMPGKRLLVCLTFDFDALSGFIARGLTTPTPISRGEFGVVASARILELLRRHEIPSTWFIPGHTIETFPDACRRVHAEGHEIAHHGWTHVPPANLSREDEERNLVRGNEAIRMITGEAARGYRSPSWDLSPHTIELLLKHGFLYDSSLM